MTAAGTVASPAAATPGHRPDRGRVAMNPETFDRLTRRLATGSNPRPRPTHSRRGLLGALAGGVAAAVVAALHRPSHAAAGILDCGGVGESCCTDPLGPNFCGL